MPFFKKKQRELQSSSMFEPELISKPEILWHVFVGLHCVALLIPHF